MDADETTATDARPPLDEHGSKDVDMGDAEDKVNEKSPLSSGKLPMPSSTAAAATTDSSKSSGTKKPTVAKRRIKLKLPMARNLPSSATQITSPDDKPSAANDGNAEVEKKKKKVVRKFKLPMNRSINASTVGPATVEETSPSDSYSVSPSGATEPMGSESEDDNPVMQPVSLSKEKERIGHSKRKTHSIKPIKIPPIASPGLLMIPPGGFPKERVPSVGVITPENLFDHHMTMAGYSLAQRVKNPHRGSSTQRHVGDMFDSNVKLTLHFPPMVPDEIWNEDGGEKPKALLKGLEKATEAQRSSGKRSRFAEMLPISLTTQFPDEYLDKRRKYVAEVQAREKSIVDSQNYDEYVLDAEQEGWIAKPNPIKIPPIPVPPSPPTVREIRGVRLPEYEDIHPAYPPKSCLAHLDKDAFHITDGRYFGLSSNFVTDPSFQGPLAPGIAGINAAQGAGLATAHSGLSSSGPGLTVSSFMAQHQSMDKKKDEGESTKDSLGVVSTSNVENNFPSPTATLDDLRKHIESGGPEVNDILDSIRKAAVFNNRSEKHDYPFSTPDGKIYPNASEAFVLFSGIKPCQKCQSSKQGVSSTKETTLLQRSICLTLGTVLYMPLATQARGS